MIRSILILSLLAVFGVAVALLISCLRRKDGDRILYFNLLIFSVALLILGAMFEAMSETLPQALMATKLQYFGIPFIGPLFLCFVLDISRIELPTVWRNLLFIVCMISTGLVLTCEHHQLYYQSVSFPPGMTIPHLNLVPGPLYYPYQIIGYACNLGSCFLLLKRYRQVSSFSKAQSLVIMIGALVPLLVNFLYLLGLSFLVMLVPHAITLMLFCIWYAIRYFGVYNLIPKAVDMAVDSMSDAMVLLSHEQSFLSANRAAFDLFPYLKEFEENRPISELTGWPLGLSLRSDEWERCGIHNFSVEQDGQEHHYEAKISKVPSPAGVSGWVLLFRDVTDTIELMDRLEELAFTDGLTRISNWRYFMESAEREFAKHLREKKPVAVMMIDIDFFKVVNDTYGHLVGDVVLKQLAEKVSGILRSFDLFARYGGEEFVALVADVSQQTAGEIAERIRKAIEKMEIVADGHTFKISVSIGVFWMAETDLPLSDAVGKADEALYFAKENGRNQVCVKS